MIFGFNTDIKVDDTVYHVQSEARASEKLLQTQVFVKGYCIGKRAVSYAEAEANGQTEDARHDRLREQHKTVIQAIREGHVNDVIESSNSKAASAAPPASTAAATLTVSPTPTPVAAPSKPIRLKLLGSARPKENVLAIRFSVTEGDIPASGARLEAEILAANNKLETFSGVGAAEGRTDDQGIVELNLPLPPNPQGEASLVVQVSFGEVTISKKFRIKTQA